MAFQLALGDSDRDRSNQLDRLKRWAYLVVLAILAFTSLLGVGFHDFYNYTPYDAWVTPAVGATGTALLVLLLLWPAALRIASWAIFLIPAGFASGKFGYLLNLQAGGMESPDLLVSLVPWTLFAFAFGYLALGRRRGLIASAALLLLWLCISLVSHALNGPSVVLEIEDIGMLFYLALVALGVFYLFAAIIERQADVLASTRLVARYATRDALTDLPNRLALQDGLEEAILAAEREGRPLALLFIDLDRFKAINDTLGHTSGDEMLRQVALRLKERVRETDVVARLGGDEFIVIMQNCSSAEHAARVAEKAAIGAETAVPDREAAAHHHRQHRHQPAAQRWGQRQRTAQQGRQRHVPGQRERKEPLPRLFERRRKRHVVPVEAGTEPP